VNAVSSDRGKYQLKARALRQQQTRHRIVAATEALHEEIGPARTTVAEIARRAGVERLTVYNNFPELKDLLRACQGRFIAGHPPPDVAPTGRGEEQLHRLERALAELYGWYRANQAMERHVHHDRHLVPELDELMRQEADPRFAAVAEAYGDALADDPKQRKGVRRLVQVALEFRTWEVLTDTGAIDAEIARLFRQAVACIASQTEPAQD
jgi:AcrR family transcriptional regulator